MKIRSFQRSVLVVFFAVTSHMSMGAEMENRSILELIRNMHAVSIDEKSVQDFFGGTINDRTDTGYWKFYEGRGKTLDDGVTITKFGFTTKNDGAASPVIYMKISGHCVRLEDVRKAYPELIAHRAATLHAPVANYIYADEEGELNFDFLGHSEDRSGCLVNIGYSPKVEKFR